MVETIREGDDVNSPQKTFGEKLKAGCFCAENTSLNGDNVVENTTAESTNDSSSGILALSSSSSSMESNSLKTSSSLNSNLDSDDGSVNLNYACETMKSNEGQELLWVDEDREKPEKKSEKKKHFLPRFRRNHNKIKPKVFLLPSDAPIGENIGDKEWKIFRRKKAKKRKRFFFIGFSEVADTEKIVEPEEENGEVLGKKSLREGVEPKSISGEDNILNHEILKRAWSTMSPKNIVAMSQTAEEILSAANEHAESAISYLESIVPEFLDKAVSSSDDEEDEEGTDGDDDDDDDDDINNDEDKAMMAVQKQMISIEKGQQQTISNNEGENENPENEISENENVVKENSEKKNLEKKDSEKKNLEKKNLEKKNLGKDNRDRMIGRYGYKGRNSAKRNQKGKSGERPLSSKRKVEATLATNGNARSRNQSEIVDVQEINSETKRLEAEKMALIRRVIQENESTTISTLGFDNTFENVTITTLNELMDSPRLSHNDHSQEKRILRMREGHKVITLKKGVQLPLNIAQEDGSSKRSTLNDAMRVRLSTPRRQKLQSFVDHMNNTEISKKDKRKLKEIENLDRIVDGAIFERKLEPSAKGKTYATSRYEPAPKSSLVDQDKKKFT